MEISKMIMLSLGLLFCFGVPFMLYSGSMKELLEEKLNVVDLKLERMQVVVFGFIHLFTFCMVILFFIFVINSSNIIPWWIYLFLIVLFFMGTIDLIILISHLIYENRQSIKWDKTRDKLLVSRKGKMFEIDLKEELEIVEYDPPIKFRAPGSGYSILLIRQNNNILKLSSQIFTEYKFYLDLTKREKYLVKKRQYNIMI